MSLALKDKTNEKNRMKKDTDEKESVKNLSEKEVVVKFLDDMQKKTKDFNLKYDISKCIEILEGKENQEFTDLKDALEAVLEEKEMLFREKIQLAAELDFIKESSKKIKKRE